MRRALVLVVLLAAMLGLDALKIERSATSNPLTLAAIGFVVLAAFTVAEAGSNMKLPRVTGYIVAGVVLGPSVLDVLSTQVVREMQMFNTLALGLIAMAAGLELHVKGLVKLWRTLAGTILIKIVLGASLVGAVLIGVETFAHSIGLASKSEIYALAVVMGALSIGTSPAIVLAVTKESGSKGRLSELVLGAAVLKDLVVVVSLAVAIAVARTFLRPGASLDAEVLVHVGKELGASIVVGAIVGGALIAYLRFVRFEMLLFVAGLILVVAELARAWHLELLLVFISAGFVVSNLSKYEHELMDAINMVSLPVFVVFFTIAGAGIDLSTTWRLLPLALALATARGLAYWVASHGGGALGGESPIVRSRAVMAYLPQAGVTLGLVGLAATQLTEVGESIRSVGMAVVAVNLLVGPVALRSALRAAGEIGGDVDAAPDLGDEPAAGDVAWPREPSLRDPLVALQDEVTQTMTIVAEERVTVTQASLFEERSYLVLSNDAPEETERTPLEAAGLELREALTTALAAVRALPGIVEVPLDDEALTVRPEDGFALRMNRRFRRLGRHVAPPLGRRKVPLRQLARIAFEPRLAALAAGLLASLARLRAGLVEQSRRVVVSGDPAEVERGEAECRRLVAEWRESCASRVREAIGHASREAAALTRRVGTPGHPASRHRYSDVEPQTRAATEDLDRVEAWEVGLAAAAAELRLLIQAREIGGAAESVIRGGAANPGAAACEVVEPALRRRAEILEELARDLPSDRAATAAELDALEARLASAGDDAEVEAMEAAYVTLRGTLNTHELASKLRTLAVGLPDELDVPRTPVAEAARADLVTIGHLAARRLVTELLADRFIPVLEERTRQLSSKVAAGPLVLRDALALAREGFASRRDLVGVSDEVALGGELRIAATRLHEAADAMRADLDALLELAQNVDDDIVTSLGQANKTTSVESRVRATRRYLRRVRDAIGAAVERVTAEIGRVLPIVHRLDETVDQAAAIRRRVDRWSETHATAAYLRHFGDKPLNEKRYFAVRQEALQGLLDAEARWLEGGPSSILIVGERGSGKTSLLNLAQIDLSASSVLRVSPLSANAPRTSLLDALAYELGCRPMRRAVERALRSRKRTVLIDDLHRWFPAEPTSIDELDELVDVMVKTQRTTCWVAAVDASVLDTWQEILAFRRVFSTVVTLGPLSVEEVTRVIERRHMASARALALPESRFYALLRKLGRSSEHEVVYRVLRGVSRGNLSEVITTWRRIVSQREDGVVEPDLRRLVDTGLSWNLDLAPVEVAVLRVLSRSGPTTEEGLARQLELSLHHLRRHLSFLLAAGLVDQAHTAGVVSVPPILGGKVVQILAQRGAWSSGESP
ncbi:MAG: cation:proton antiporter [Polyangiaceae bacterium]